MSYSILYNHQFIKDSSGINIIPIALIGSNNVYENTGTKMQRRCRDWQNLPLVDDQVIYTPEEIMAVAEGWRSKYAENARADKSSDPQDQYTDKRFGWYASMAMYGKTCSTTSFSNVLGFFRNGIENALTLEELKSWGFTPYITSYRANSVEKEEFYPSTFDEIKTFYDAQKALGNSPFIKVSANENVYWRVKKKKNSIGTLKTPLIADNSFVIKFGSGEFVSKKIKRGFTYSTSRSHAKLFKTQRLAEKYLNSIREKLKNKPDVIACLKVDHPTTSKK